MAYLNGDRLMLNIPGHGLVEMTSTSFTIPPKQRVGLVIYYYRRGQKYFFRGLMGRLVVSSFVFENGVKLKRGETYKVKISFY